MYEEAGGRWVEAAEKNTGLKWKGAKAYQARQPQSMERYGLRLAVHQTSDEGASRA